MAIFELEDKGKTYEIDAPDMQSAVSAFRKLQGQPDQQFVGGVMGGGPISQIASAIKGRQDPAYQDVGTVFDQFRGELHNPTANAATFGADDAAMADIIQKNLGDKFIRRERDANGYDVFVTRGPDGQEQRGYVNQPGLDTQDIARTVRGALPFVAVGGGVAGVTRNMAGPFAHLVAKPAAQGASAATTSVAGDVASSHQGSEQGISLEKAGFAGLLGTGAELLSPAVGGLARWWRGPKPHINDAGGLTDEAAAAARQAGLDPSQLDTETARQFAIGLNRGADPKEIASMIQTNRFGIPTTKATRTKDPQLSAIEKDIRSGNLGEDAKRIMSEFDVNQRRELQGSALTRPNYDEQTMLRRARNQPGDPYKEGMGAMVAPTRTAVTPDDVAPGRLATSIQDNLKGVQQRGEEAISKAFEPVGDVTPRPQAFESLPRALKAELGDIRVTNELTPVATQMVRSLEGYSKGKALVGNQADDFLGQTPLRTIVEQQRSLLAMKEAAQNGADRAAAKAIYNGYNNWIDEIADAGLVNGDPAAATALRTARQVTREVKSLFDPRGRDIHPAAGRILNEIVHRDNNADSIVGKLFSGPTSAPKDGAVDALRAIRKALFDPLKSTGKSLADPMEAARTWNDIRMAYWSRLVVDSKGNMASPTVAANNISAAMHNHQGLLGALFEPKEIGVMQQYVRALKQASFKDPNPSGTATALRALGRNDGNWIKDLLQTQSNRELFSKHNVFMSRLYRVLAKKIPVDILGSRGAAGSAAAREATDQSFTAKPYRSLGPFGAGATAGWGSQE